MRGRVLALALAVALCAAAVGSASAAGGHQPGFSFMDKKVGVTKLPEAMRFAFGDFPGVKAPPLRRAGHGPYWFGEVQRPNGAIYAAADRRQLCISEVREGEGGGDSDCTSPSAAREFGLDHVGSCGEGPPRHFRIYGLVPDGVTGLEIEKAGRDGRTVPVIENTFAFTIGRENVHLHGLGDAAAEGFERDLPLAETAKRFPGDGQAGCSFYTFFEAATKGE